MIKRLGHLCFMSNQLPAMLAFYRDTVGLPVKFALRHADGTPFGYYFAAGATTFVPQHRALAHVALVQPLTVPVPAALAVTVILLRAGLPA